MTNIQRLEKWLAAQTSTSEKDCGVRILSTDNTGWWVTIDLKNTPLSTKDFTAVRHGIARGDEGLKSLNETGVEGWSSTLLEDGTLYATMDNDWMDCSVKNAQFQGAGDTAKLDTILGIFLDWAES